MKEVKNLEEPSRNWLEAYDGPVAAPEHHKVVFENERIRIMEFTIGPGEIVPVHTHQWPTVNYVVSHSDFLSRDAEGHVRFDSRGAEAEMPEGTVFCLPAFPPLHSVENIGANEMRGLSVELKD